MRLIAFSLEGYRRFTQKTAVKTHGNLLAFVGPNEAGKSSLLQALDHLNSTEDFAPNESPRRTSMRPSLSWHFQLEAADKEALSGINDCDRIERLVITKDAGRETRTWRYEPKNPRRERSHRRALSVRLKAFRSDFERFLPAEEEAAEEVEKYMLLVELLDADQENYSDANLQQLRDLTTMLLALELDQDEVEDGNSSESRTSAISSERDDLVKMLKEAEATESLESPWRLATNALKDRIPRIILFGEADRNLASEYDLNEVADEPSPALGHLASLARLDLKALRDETVARQTANVATRRLAANRTLSEAFDQSWNQQGIALQMEVQGTILHIHATTPGDSGFSEIGERSDGLRWFAALLAFAHGWNDKPILLVDEIEKHLHYDAQADLITVLSRQNFTSKVVYTTHSFGCLPFDLGTGVKVVRPQDSTTSRLENGFWNRGAGFSPLMASMGAATMSFTPARHAVLSEGPSDAILLPTLLRQASALDNLGFQVAPGLASIAAILAQELDAEAGRVAYLVDGDDGGQQIRKKLETAGVPSEKILVLQTLQKGEGIETEDLVNPEIYKDAVNEELRCWNELKAEISVETVDVFLRTKAVASWCHENGYDPPDKTAVAQRIVDASVDNVILHPEMGGELGALMQEICRVLQIGQ